MKIVRLFTVLIVAIFVISAWTPVPVLAKADAATTSIAADSVSANGDLATAKLVKLSIVNQTGGVIYITLSGPRSYYFSATEPGKNVFMIEKGKYAVTLRTSACSGTVTRKINGGGSLGTFRCFKNKK